MRFLISVIDDGQSYAAGKTDSATRSEATAIDAFNNRLVAEGHWVLAEGLSLPSSATVVDARGDDSVITDGPFLESQDFVAGLWIWEAADLETALKLAADGSSACNRKLEVRPILS